ncbi:MAG: hypothetical protein IH586_05575, partial [Anaerolineaceae bacterium]|nr:hypothetical protein [Anaerolineaceae bacterium]
GIDFLSLHCLPSNDLFLEQLSDLQAYYSLMAQPDSWERVFIPDILRIAAKARSTQTTGNKLPMRIAITEWGVLGPRERNRPVVENYGEVPYAGIFLNMVMRNCEQVPISNATALLHGGCIRKASGQVFFDPQYLVIQKYTKLAGANVIHCSVESPTYDVDRAPDLGLPLKNIPLIDVTCCHKPDTGEFTVCIVNRLLDQCLPVQVLPETDQDISRVAWEYITHPDLTSRARLGEPEQFAIQTDVPIIRQGVIDVTLPPCSVNWISYFITHIR